MGFDRVKKKIPDRSDFGEGAWKYWIYFFFVDSTAAKVISILRNTATENGKDPGPQNPALISPNRVESALNSSGNGGIMEFWVSKADDGQKLDSLPCHPHKNRSHSINPNIPTLQYSINPLCRITAQPIFSDLGQVKARRPVAWTGNQVFNDRINR